MRTEFRINALSLVNLITKQSIKMAQLEGRMCEKTEANKPKVGQLTFSKMVQSNPNSAITPVAKATKTVKPKLKPKVQHLAVIRPIEESNDSKNTRAFIQKNLDITNAKIGVKKVSPIKNGGILIETMEMRTLVSFLRKWTTVLRSDKGLQSLNL
ncbi:hypothetical protein CDAR_410571 [Caerostris darwini]|uniref:Uncharacterized protein n=1 Tax=Caerostris darwini TaxID=1538125 RepID=A0AAV4N8J7_9ARAC|nr:hypothetical protein CDAR_410571 [Caerostris darwini]